MKINTAAIQLFSEHASSFHLDTKGPITPASQNKSYIHVIVDAFSHFVVLVPIKSNNAKTAAKTLLHHWIVKFGPPIHLVTDRGPEYINTNMAHLCILWVLDTLLEQLTPLGLQNKNLGTHFRMFLQQNTPKDSPHQVHMYAFAHNSQPLSTLDISPHEIVFHIRPRIPLPFDLNLNRNKNNPCISQYSSQLPQHSHYDKTDSNPIIHKTLSQNLFHNGFLQL